MVSAMGACYKKESHVSSRITSIINLRKGVLKQELDIFFNSIVKYSSFSAKWSDFYGKRKWIRLREQ